MNNRKSIKFLAILFLLLFLGNGCLKDDCNTSDTFNGITAELANQSGTVLLKLNCNTFESLPLEYFKNIDLISSENGYNQDNFNWQNDHAQIEEISVDANVVISLSLKEIDPNITQKSYSLHIRFEDRRAYIDCSHPGSNDAYFLDLDFKLTKAGTSWDLSDFKWEESLRKGAK